MAGESASTLVIFIASILVAATVAGALVTGVDRISDSMAEESVTTSEDIRTDVTIISDTGSDAIYDETDGNGTITLLVKNTGSNNLEATADQIDVLVNGQFVPRTDVTVTSLEGDEFEWHTGSVIRVEIERTVEGTDNRVQVSVRGDREEVTFRA